MIRAAGIRQMEENVKEGHYEISRKQKTEQQYNSGNRDGTRRKHRRTFILWQPVPDRALHHVSFLPVPALPVHDNSLLTEY